MCDTRIEDLLTQISGRMGDCIDQVSAAFSAFQKAHAADELSGEVGDLGSAIHRLKEDRSTWTEIREEQKNKARLVGGGMDLCIGPAGDASADRLRADRDVAR